MKTNDLLNELNQNVSDAYDVIEAGGGAMPSDRITWNLANAIRTLPDISGNKYGKVGYYPTTEGYEFRAEGEGLQIGNVDETKFAQFLQENPPGDPNWIDFSYEQDYDPETGEPTGEYVWRYGGEATELSIPAEGFTATTGIEVTIAEDTDWGEIMVQREVVVHTDAPLLYGKFSSQEEFNSFAGWQESATINGKTVVKKAVASIETGSMIATIPKQFVTSYFTNLTHIDLSNSPITTMEDDCIQQLPNYDEEFVIPSGVTVLPKNFLYNCSKFNHPVIFPEGLTTINQNAMCSLTSFNQNVTLPSTLKTITAPFMQYCNNMTSTIDFGKLKPSGVTISSPNNVFSTNSNTSKTYTVGIVFDGDYSSDWYTTFPTRTSNPYRKTRQVYGMKAYAIVEISGQDTRIDFTDIVQLCDSSTDGNMVIGNTTVQKNKIKEIHIISLTGDNIQLGDNFCYSMKGLTTIEFPTANNITTFGNNAFRNCILLNCTLPFSKVTTVGASFLQGCTSLNQTVTFGIAFQTIGDNFMRDCTSFNQPLYTNFVRRISNYFLCGCTSFDQQIMTSSNCTTIGKGFLKGCTAFNSGVEIHITSSWLSALNIGAGFMQDCDSFNGYLFLEDGIGAKHFAADSGSDYSFATSNANASVYTQGFPIIGDIADEFVAKFANRTSSPYRKIVKKENNFIRVSNPENIYRLESSEIVNLCDNGAATDTITIGGRQIIKQNIYAVTISTPITTVGNYFCYNFGLSTTPSYINLPNTITTVGDYFFAGNTRLTKAPADALPNVMVIGNYFYQDCSSVYTIGTWNHTLTSIGNDFMNYLNRYDPASGYSATTIKLSVSGSIGNNFMEKRRYQAGSIDITVGGNIGDNFCSQRGRTIKSSKPLTSTTTVSVGGSIGDNFLGTAGGQTFNGQIKGAVTISGACTTIGNNFLGASKCFYVGTLTLPSNLQHIGDNFCSGTTSDVTVSLPQTLQSVGHNFMSGNDYRGQAVDLGDLPATIFAGAGDNSDFSFGTGNNSTNIPIKQDGFPVITSHQEDFLAKFPERLKSPAPYRKWKFVTS